MNRTDWWLSEVGVAERGEGDKKAYNFQLQDKLVLGMQCTAC